MRENRPEDGNYQTKVLEVNITIAHPIVENNLQMRAYKLYNKPKLQLFANKRNLINMNWRIILSLKISREYCLILMLFHLNSFEITLEWWNQSNAWHAHKKCWDSADKISRLLWMLLFKNLNLMLIISFRCLGSFDGISSSLEQSLIPPLIKKFIINKLG